MKKTIYTLAILASIFASCTGDLEDDINSIEGNLTELQAENDALAAENDALQAELDGVSTDLSNVTDNLTDAGINAESPFTIVHDYSYNADNPITEEFTFLDLSRSYINERSTDYYINLQSGNNNDEAYLRFFYDTDTKKATLYQAKLYDGANIYGRYTEAYIYENNTGATYDLTVNSFDASTGEISVDFKADYTGSYYYSTYDTDGSISFSFTGTLTTTQSVPSSNDSAIIDKLETSEAIQK